MREPDREWRIELWQTNHSYDKLVNEEAIDFTAYRLGYEMEEEVDDPTKTAYKYFSKDIYPEGNVTQVHDYKEDLPVWLCADFNRAPMAWALMQVHKTRAGQNLYVIFDEIFSKEALTTEQAMFTVEKLRDSAYSASYWWAITRLTKEVATMDARVRMTGTMYEKFSTRTRSATKVDWTYRTRVAKCASIRSIRSYWAVNMPKGAC